MPQSQHFSAWISIDGVDDPVPEYSIETSENQQEFSCWIPSEVGKKFTVNWTNISLPGLTGGGVTVDGHRCGFEAIASDTRPITAFMDGIAETDTKTRPFVFAPLELTGTNLSVTGGKDRHMRTPGTKVLIIFMAPLFFGGKFSSCIILCPQCVVIKWHLTLRG